MNLFKTILFLVVFISLTSCASGYRNVQPKTLNYVSSSENNGVKLEYKYDVLTKKYSDKELKKGVKVVAVRLTNNSNEDLMFGKEIKLAYENGNEIFILENEKVFKSLRQKSALYLLYLLLAPINLTTTQSNGSSSTYPIGLGIGPLISGLNVAKANMANKRFKTEINEFNINGTLIKKGESKYGLIGIKAEAFETLKVKIE